MKSGGGGLGGLGGGGLGGGGLGDGGSAGGGGLGDGGSAGGFGLGLGGGGHVPLMVHFVDHSFHGDTSTERFCTLDSAAPKRLTFSEDKFAVMVTVYFV